MAKRTVLTAALLLLTAAGLLPLLAMLLKSVTVDGHWSFAYYYDLFSSDRPFELLRNSSILAALTTLLATGAGVPLAVLFARTDLPLRRMFTVLFTIPLLLPPYITAVSWFHLVGRQGLFSRVWGERFAEWTSSQLLGLPGCVLVLVPTFLPIPMLLTMAYLHGVDQRLEEAGRLVAGWGAVLRKITLPLILPGVVLGATLVFLLSLGELGVPTFLRFDVFAVESLTQFAAFHNFGAATAAAVPLVLVTLLILWAEWRLFGQRVLPFRMTAPVDPSEPIRLRQFRLLLLLAVIILCLLLVVLPLAGLAAQSASLGVYSEALQRAGDSLLRSIGYAVAGASALTVLGFFLGYLVQKNSLGAGRFVDALTLFLFAVPGSVIGIGLVGLWNAPATAFIYASPGIVLLGYLAQYSALTTRATVATLNQIPPSMEESAEVAGAGWLRRIVHIVVPLSRRGLLAAWLLAYIFCLRDLGITMLVYPPGGDTLPVRTFTLMANGPPDLVAALCMMMVAATLLPLLLFGIVAQRGREPGVVH